ncbi:ABC transporter permease [Kiloniella laminariae]|uniref:Transport permease protein n=1 Tax=Kiloniella laminariae TaxID=454162 RepID=A0ABT4LMC4_9PROT|nr:ABC transporter permease [Kiloniella laminariae]MCZ4282242.1 ABC transporter permease [Kiloniella laminariae]
MTDPGPKVPAVSGIDQPIRVIALLRVWTLFYRRGVVRFMRFWTESLLGPMISTMLFMTVFTLALDSGQQIAPGLTALQFVAPGLAAFVLVQISFQNVCFMLIIDKQEGVIADVLMAPLTPLELLLGYGLAGVMNGLIVSVLIMLAMTVFTGPMLYAVGYTLFFGIVAAFLFAMIGVLVGLWSEKWDQFSMIDNFLVLPLGLLSGTFFTLDRIPSNLQWLFEANPMFWIINGFRYGITGYGDPSMVLWQGTALLVITVVAFLAGWTLMARGYKIKA